ncbi:hypothetical protein [Guggenheimella bovis]
MKKCTMLLLTVLFLGMTLMACGKSKAESKEIVFDKGRFVTYETAQEIRGKSDLVVEVTKTDESSCSREEFHDIKFDYLLAKVRIDKILKPSSKIKLAVGDVITVSEGQYTVNNIIHNLDSYRVMEMGHKYRLYLLYESEGNFFKQMGVLQGKLPLDPEEPLWYDGKSAPAFESILEELRNNP